MIETDLRAALLASAEVVALVADRVSPLVAPEGEPLPYITYRLIDGSRPGSLCSTGGTTREARMEVNCWASTYGESKALAEAAQLAVESSALFDPVFNGEQDFRDKDTKAFRVALDYTLWD